MLTISKFSLARNENELWHIRETHSDHVAFGETDTVYYEGKMFKYDMYLQVTYF